MPRSRRLAWVLNLDAEHELSRIRYSRSGKLDALLGVYAERARALLAPGDVLVEPDVKLSEPLTGRAWCPTPLALSLLTTAGAIPEPSPSREVLCRVNHRRFGLELGGGPPGAAYVTTRSELSQALRASGDWLLKRPLSFAGRGQLRIRTAVTADQWPAIDACLRRGGLLLEPFVEPVVEFGLHGFIWQSGAVLLGRVCVQEVGTRGVWKATRLAYDADLGVAEQRELYGAAERVSEALSRAGYFGPFGIDAYRYRLHGQVAFCALSEINARYTMGFAVGFPRPLSELVLE
jgi:hypothetical protein